MKNESFITKQFQNGDKMGMGTKWGWGQNGDGDKMWQINKF
jgi:hypothetical protein